MTVSSSEKISNSDLRGLIRKERVAILGYGNQGRAHALNLRDSGVVVSVGSRPGKSFDMALADGFQPSAFISAVEKSDCILFLLPDEIIPEVYQELKIFLERNPRRIGFAHGFCYHYELTPSIAGCQYFLAGPKGAGAILRSYFVEKKSLPGVYAIAGESFELDQLAQSYCQAIGIGDGILVKTSFQEETECDLFGEQSVLCGGLPQLMEAAFDTLVINGHSPEMALLECCYEVKTIIELWLKQGPLGMSEKISQTAFYGGLTRGKELIDENSSKKLQSIFNRIRSREFSTEWMKEVAEGRIHNKKEKERIATSLLEATYQKLKKGISTL